jgi:endonuclease III related protein
MRGAALRPDRSSLRRVYRRLRARYGPAGWWPGRTSLEVCIGAILTQNTSWTNVERAIGELRRRGVLNWNALRAIPVDRLATLIRASGTYTVKARRLRAFFDFLEREHGGRVASMRRFDPWALRSRLLAVHGIGPETADSIVLYGAGLPVFVVDAYTRRVFSRLGLVRGDESYDELQRFFMTRLAPDPALYNDYHAQIVRLAKEACRTRPRCAACPLEDLCPKRGVSSGEGALSRSG